jgi:hypothetical protein
MRKFIAAAPAFAAIIILAGCSQRGGDSRTASYAGRDIQRFAVSLQGEDVGYMEIRIEELPGDSLLVTQETSWDLILMGNRRHVAMTLEARTDSNLDMASMDLWMTDGSSEILTSSVRIGNELHTVITSAGRDIEMSTDFEGDYLPVLADLAAAWMDWETGQERVFPTFDPATGMVFDATVICIGHEQAVLLGDTVEAVRLSISQVGLSNTVWIWDGQIIREEEVGLGMIMSRVPQDQTGEITGTRDLYEVFAISSTPVDDPRRLGSRTFEMHGDIDWSVFVLDYLPVQVHVDGRITVSTRIPVDVVSFPIRDTGGFEQYLAAEPMLQSEDSLLILLADSLTAGSRTAWDAAVRLGTFVDLAVANSPTVSLPSAVDVLENLRGDCNEHTVLFVALARAAGIPSRVCAGVVYLNGVFGYHAWPMVWVGEWVPMDPTLSQSVADPTHIILAVGSLESQYVINSVMGRLSITEVVP